jgi:hypothetical protein
VATSSNSQHLHYGGSFNPKSGRLGPKPQQGSQFRKLKRFELIARLENAGLGEGAVAAMLCVSVPRLRYLKRDPEYLSTRVKITHGIIVNHQDSLDLIKSQRREMLTQMLPPALQILANELQRPTTTIAERKHQTSVALELLDREGTFAKVSRTEIKPVDSFDFEKADAQSASIISAIRSIALPGASSEISAAALEANREFSNSHTLSAIDQQKALDTLDREGELSPELLEILPTGGAVN